MLFGMCCRAPVSVVSVAVLLALLLVPATAHADITAFLGVNATPTNRMVRGLAGGVGLLIVAFEFEYANTSEDVEEGAPGLKTFMVNGLLQTPMAIGGLQFYGTAGVGGYRETLDDRSETNVGMNFGGGVKISVAGPLRLRLDYRVFTLQGDARHERPQRFYAGANLKF
jgi:opacity protein-like surface antigen